MTHTDVFCEPHFPIREEEYVDLQHPRLPVVVQKLLGHATLASTTVYLHARDEDLRRAVEAVAAGERWQ